MIRIYIIVALVVATALTSLQWRHQVQANRQLADDNRVLQQQITAAGATNEALMQQIGQMVSDHNDLQKKIRDAEQSKLVADRENQRLRHEIEQGLKGAPAWSATEVPGSVLAGVRGSIGRLYTY